MEGRKYQKVNTEENQILVNMAIDELTETNQKITIPAISKITEIKVSNLYNFPNLKKYRNKISTRKPKVIIAPSRPLKEFFLEHTVDSYTQYIKDNFFAKSESLDEVRYGMLVEVANYDESVFKQAINLMVKNGELVKLSSVSEQDRYIFTPTIEPVVVDTSVALPILSVVVPEVISQPAHLAKTNEKMEPAEVMTLSWTLSNKNIFEINFPELEKISTEDLEDINDVLNLLLKKVNRSLKSKTVQ